jgi:hypothetical protein
MGQTLTRGRLRVEHGRKRIRAYLGGELAADIRADLVPTGTIDHSPSRGDAEIFDLRTPRATAPAAARRYRGSPVEDLRQAVRLDWDAVQQNARSALGASGRSGLFAAHCG